MHPTTTWETPLSARTRNLDPMVGATPSFSAQTSTSFRRKWSKSMMSCTLEQDDEGPHIFQTIPQLPRDECLLRSSSRSWLPEHHRSRGANGAAGRKRPQTNSKTRQECIYLRYQHTRLTRSHASESLVLRQRQIGRSNPRRLAPLVPNQVCALRGEIAVCKQLGHLQPL